MDPERKNVLKARANNDQATASIAEVLRTQDYDDMLALCVDLNGAANKGSRDCRWLLSRMHPNDALLTCRLAATLLHRLLADWKEDLLERKETP